METPPQRQIDNWQDAEHNAATWMRHWGYEDAVAKPGGSDGGIDIQAREACGQVKFEGAPVGRPVLQRLVGAGIHSKRELFFFTGSGYSKAAIEYAAAAGIALFVYDPWGRMRAVNAEARSVVSIADNMHRVSSGIGREGSEPRGSVDMRGPRAPDEGSPRPAKTGRWALVMALICFYLPINWFFAEPGYDHAWYVNVVAVTVAIGLGIILLRVRSRIRKG